MEKLDLKTLEWVKYMFHLQSDRSTQCDGFSALCSLIDDVKNKTKHKLVCSKCGAEYEVGEWYVPMCTAPCDYRTSGICGGGLIVKR